MIPTGLRSSLVAASLCLAAACGGAPPPSAAPPPAASSTAPEAEGPITVPTAWSADLPKPVQIAFMKKNVEPRMRKVFSAHEASYASLDCKTCHGPEYKAPKDFLPRLTMHDGKFTAFSDKPEIAKFMAEQVVPEMAQAMGEPAYDPQTHKGFGCMGCHAVDMK